MEEGSIALKPARITKVTHVMKEKGRGDSYVAWKETVITLVCRDLDDEVLDALSRAQNPEWYDRPTAIQLELMPN